MFDSREVNIKNKTSGKGKNKKKQQQETMETDAIETEDVDEPDIEESFDKEKVKSLFGQASEALFVLLNKISLSTYTDIRLMTTLLVRDMARIDMCQDSNVEIIENLENFKKLPRLSDRSFALMHRLIDGRHTAGGYMVISRIVYPRLAYWTFELDVIPSSSAIPVSFDTWKNLMVKFVRIRAEKEDKKELSYIFRVLENLYQRCTDRLEYRTRLAQSVLDVLLVLPRKYHFEFVHKLDIFSRTERVAVRNFSIEIAPLLLLNLDLSGPDQCLSDCADGAEKVNEESSRVGDAILPDKSSTNSPTAERWNV
ncbi:hypothetical protein KIN20_019053 [Parelaphostrongylus tenuis]|uniref:Uncharacterized protein n=1 Tax=Parelaphostrongylus tenuis TaxID=148309 RepID=A0AAD5N2P2_PARTN|nr:hypothetical protein KIN20_019053 [Parelaphostrongylus tenuis]